MVQEWLMERKPRSGSGSVPKAGRLSVPIWCRSPGGFLETHWALVFFGILKKQVAMPVKEYLMKRIDKLAHNSKDIKAKNKSFLIPSLLCELLPEGVV